MELVTKEVVLSDGRIVVLQECNGFDDMMVDRLVREDKTIDNKANAVAFAMVLSKVGAIFSIISIDGTEQRRPKALKDVHATAMQFKKRDLEKLVMAYTELNSDIEVGAMGESQADEQN